MTETYTSDNILYTKYCRVLITGKATNKITQSVVILFYYFRVVLVSHVIVKSYLYLSIKSLNLCYTIRVACGVILLCSTKSKPCFVCIALRMYMYST